MQKRQKRIGEILIEKGLITPRQLKDALDEQQRTKEFLGEILLKKRYIKEGDLLKALSEQFNIPVISLKNRYIDWDFVKSFSPSLILDYKCFPVQRDEWSVTIAITNPLDVWVFQKAEAEAKGLRLRLVLVSKGDIDEVIQRYRQYMRDNISKLFQ